jgi:hypothetical protein
MTDLSPEWARALKRAGFTLGFPRGLDWTKVGNKLVTPRRPGPMQAMSVVAIVLTAAAAATGSVQVDVDATPIGVYGDEIWPNFVG